MAEAPSRGEPPCDSCPTVSIVLLTYNGMPVVTECFKMLLSQHYPSPVEVIHIDSGSTDDTVKVAAAHGITTRRISKRQFHHSRTRNLAATMAKNEIVVFVSQDAVPSSRQWLKNLIEPFVDPVVGGVYGRQIAPSHISLLRQYGLLYTYPQKREVRHLSDGMHGSLPMFRFSNVNSAIRRDLVNRLCFDERAMVCEDHGMCRDILMAGYNIVYEPEAAVIHGHQRSLLEEFQWSFYNGCSLKRMGILDCGGNKSEFAYGLARLEAEWSHFVARGMPLTALHGLLISIMKWVGVQIGKREEQIPSSILRWLFKEYKSCSGH